MRYFPPISFITVLYLRCKICKLFPKMCNPNCNLPTYLCLVRIYCPYIKIFITVINSKHFSVIFTAMNYLIIVASVND